MNLFVPKHIAIMMDGNGRWGKEHGVTRSEGHYAGAKTMQNIIDASIEMDIKILTLYAFSSENWSRPENEVSYLMQLPIRFFKQKLPDFIKRNIKILVSGNLSELPEQTRNVLVKAMEQTKENDGIIVNFAFNYGGRGDILQAARQIIREIQLDHVQLENVDQEMVRHFLYTKDLPDPELVIRTGGEKRVSNFLLWQSSMAELYFSDVYFPDFNRELLFRAIHELNRRNALHEAT